MLKAKRVSVSEKYTDLSDIFSKEFAAVLPNCSDINKHVINPEPGKQPPYKSIYSLGLVKLEIFKIYIKINLVNGFIQPSMFPVEDHIFFALKPDKSFCL